MKLKITKDFTYWHGGCNRADYAAGSEVEADDAEMAAVALEQGWASESGKAVRPAENKAKKAAPENK